MHLIQFPATVVIASVSPPVPARAAYIVLFEVAHIDVAIAPYESARALLLTTGVGTFKPRAVRPPFEALSMLLVVFPETSEVAAVFVQIVAETVSLIIEEFTLVNVSICMDEAAEEAP